MSSGSKSGDGTFGVRHAALVDRVRGCTTYLLGCGQCLAASPRCRGLMVSPKYSMHWLPRGSRTKRRGHITPRLASTLPAFRSPSPIVSLQLLLARFKPNVQVGAHSKFAGFARHSVARGCAVGECQHGGSESALPLFHTFSTGPVYSHFSMPFTRVRLAHAIRLTTPARSPLRARRRWVYNIVILVSCTLMNIGTVTA